MIVPSPAQRCLDVCLDVYLGVFRHVFGHVFGRVFRHVHGRMKMAVGSIFDPTNVCSDLCSRRGHNYLGHNYLGHNYLGHNYWGHNYLAITNVLRDVANNAY